MAAETKAGTLRIIGEELEALRKRIIANHEAAGQVASGRTKGSLKVEMSEDGGVLSFHWLLVRLLHGWL